MMKKCAKIGGVLEFNVFGACISYVLCFVTLCAHKLINQLRGWGRYRVRSDGDRKYKFKKY